MHGYVPAFQNDRDKKQSRVDFHTGCPTVIKKKSWRIWIFQGPNYIHYMFKINFLIKHEWIMGIVVTILFKQKVIKKQKKEI